MPGITVRGVQTHIGSQITEAAPFVAAIEKLAPLVSELKSKYAIEFFSVGGGLGIAYESSVASGSGDWWSSQRLHPLTIQQYVDAILPPLTRLGLRILLEPGRLLVGNAGILLTRVCYIKETAQKKFAIIDAGMNDLIRPALYGSYHEIVPVERLGGTRSVPSKPRKDDTEVVPPSTGVKMDIVGPVCESGDFFAQDREMPELRAGDLLAVMSAGAYGFVMASNYNSRPLPAEALVREDKLALIRKRQTIDDLIRDEVDPTW
jgi:diaminopimelate decarboxylase